jgi:hypothetical protein
MGASGSCCANLILNLELNIRWSDSRRAAREWGRGIDHCVTEKKMVERSEM